VDLFTFDSDNYLVAADYFSDFFVLEQLPDTTTTSVVEMLKRPNFYEFILRKNPDIRAVNLQNLCANVYFIVS